MKDGYLIVLTTVPNSEQGVALGKKIVEEGLAACCNIIHSVRSIYVWKGKVCDEEEAMCLFKTRAALFDQLKKRIRELHSYEVPEIIAVDIEAGLKEYLGWIDEVTGGK